MKRFYLEAERVYFAWNIHNFNSNTNYSGQECVQNSNMQLGVTENLTVLRSRHAFKYIKFHSFPR